MPLSPEATWLNENWDTLPENEWVAVGKDGLVDHAPRFDELVKKLESKCIDSSDCLFAFVPRRGEIWQ